MKKVIIAFDIDGTLRANSDERHRDAVEPNPRALRLLIDTAHSKNVEIHLWSNRGADYCREMREILGLQKYVKAGNCHFKLWDKMQKVAVLQNGNIVSAQIAEAFRPDIAYDDQQNFDGADVVIVVREK